MTDAMSAVSFFKDCRRVVTASEDRFLRIWDTHRREFEKGTFEEHRDRVNSVAVSADNEKIISGGDDAMVII